MNEILLKWFVDCVLCELQSKKFCSHDNTANKWIWHENARSFHYLLWYLTELARANNLCLSRGKTQLNIKAFQSLFIDPPQIDKTEMSKIFYFDFYSGKPKELIEKAVKKILKNVVIKLKE